MARRIYNLVKHLGWRFFAKIGNDFTSKLPTGAVFQDQFREDRMLFAYFIQKFSKFWETCKNHVTLNKKRSFPLRIVTKSAVSCRFGHIY